MFPRPDRPATVAVRPDTALQFCSRVLLCSRRCKYPPSLNLGMRLHWLPSTFSPVSCSYPAVPRFSPRCASRPLGAQTFSEAYFLNTFLLCVLWCPLWLMLFNALTHEGHKGTQGKRVGTRVNECEKQCGISQRSRSWPSHPWPRIRITIWVRPRKTNPRKRRT